VPANSSRGRDTACFPADRELALAIVAETLRPLRSGQRGDLPARREFPAAFPIRTALVTRLDAFISAYGARGHAVRALEPQPFDFELLLQLSTARNSSPNSRSATPDLVTSWSPAAGCANANLAGEILRDLRHGLKDEDQHAWLRRYHQAELMRIGLRDILGLADFEQYLTELSALADACLQYALQVVMRKHKLKTAPFAIIGLGKLGGRKLNYGSDLRSLVRGGQHGQRPGQAGASCAGRDGLAVCPDGARNSLYHRRPASTRW